MSIGVNEEEKGTESEVIDPSFNALISKERLPDEIQLESKTLLSLVCFTTLRLKCI